MAIRWIGWTALMVVTGLVTAYLRSQIDPLVPSGQWDGLLSGIFVIVVWPALMWSQRSFARNGF